MFSLEFVKQMQTPIKTYKNFIIPAIICDMKFNVFWSNKLAKQKLYHYTGVNEIHDLFSELDYNKVRKILKDKGNYSIAGLVPLSEVTINISPLYDEDDIVGMVLLFMPYEMAKGYDIDYISKATDSVSGQIRETLNEVFNSCDNMVAKADLVKSSWLIPYANKININGYKVLRIAENYTNFVRLRDKDYELNNDNIELIEWMQNISEIIRAFADELKINVKFNVPSEEIYLIIDKQWFEFAFFNVLHNAMFYNAPNNEIEISVSEEYGNVKFIISDKGIGIPDDIMGKIFVPYFSSDHRGQVTGSGLGLTVAKKVVELYGGTINVESQVDKGTTVTVVLPLRTFSSQIHLNQTTKSHQLIDRFSTVHIGLTSALLTPFKENGNENDN